jgi:hypothetical protein
MRIGKSSQNKHMARRIACNMASVTVQRILDLAKSAAAAV